MTLRNLASLAVALLLGLIAVIIIRNVVLSSKPAGAGRVGTTTAVVVAALPVERGVVLKPAMLKVVNYPAAAVPAGAFSAVAQLTGPKPRQTMRAMAADEPVLAAKLDGGAKPTLSETLTPGMRAVSVKSDDVAGVGGFVLPGDRVDIFLTRTTGGNGAAQTTLTQTLAENARVLGVDQVSDTEAQKPVVAKAVTVEVTPDQAQAISLGHQVGTVSLALRQSADKDPLARKAMTVADLGGGGPHAPAAHVARPRPKPAPAMQVHVTRGVLTTDYPAGAN